MLIKPSKRRWIAQCRHHLQRLLSALTLLVALASCFERPPIIHAIDPQIGYLGDTLTITGEGFGDDKNESYIVIGGISPTASSYYEWSNSRISVRIPEFGDSGLVYVYRNNKKSNAALFSNRAAIPQILGEESHGITPRISALEPETGAPGDLIVIRGRAFGTARGDSGVFFAWSAEASPAAPEEFKGPSSIEVCEHDLGYEFWSDREIHVRVPSGAVSGNVEVRTSRGRSMEYFTVARRPGTQLYRDKLRYAISYSVDIQVWEASSENTLYLSVPLPAASASQRGVELLYRNMQPFMENYRGISLFQFKNLQSNTNAQVSLSFLVEVYGIETVIQPNQIQQGGTNPLVTALTQPSLYVLSDLEQIRRQGAAIIGRETNPYVKARLIYEWMLREIAIEREGAKGGALEALEEKRADPLMASLLFCSLGRAVGIPCIPIAGVLADRYTARPHVWVEFWVNGFGWVPVDLALGSGMDLDFIFTREDRVSVDPKTYYFGNLDNQHITFSRGLAVLSPMEPLGRIMVQDRNYALQTIWEEAARGLESYSSFWSDIAITGIYVE